MNTKLMVVLSALVGLGVGLLAAPRMDKNGVASQFADEIKAQCNEYIEAQLAQSNAETQLGAEGYADYKAALSMQCTDTAITLRAVLEDVLYGGSK